MRSRRPESDFVAESAQRVGMVPFASRRELVLQVLICAVVARGGASTDARAHDFCIEPSATVFSTTGLTAVEDAIHNPHAKVDYDILGGRHGGAKLYSRLSWLFSTAQQQHWYFGWPCTGILHPAVI